VSSADGENKFALMSAMPHLFFKIRIHGARYHGLDTWGRPEWPPSPARLFQAFIAGAAKGAVLCEKDRDALVWLERLDPPVIAAPAARMGQYFSHFMPNNDLDTVGGDINRISEIRTATKRFHPRIFDRETPFLYAWPFDHGREHAERMRDLADRLYQLGRGVDMAWAIAEILDSGAAEARLSDHSGAIYRPTLNGVGSGLACQFPGSLSSLIDRYAKDRTRFKIRLEPAPRKKTPSRAKSVRQTFSQSPKPRFNQVSYNCPPVRQLYDLRDMTQNAAFHPWPFSQAVRLVEMVRNGVAEKLKAALPDKTKNIEQIFGLCRHSSEADKATRIRIIPLPSIGHQYADHGIRRLLVEIPPDCRAIAADDIDWGFSGFGSIEEATGEISWALNPAEERGMLAHYGIGDENQPGSRLWHTVTPMALPLSRPRGRKSGSERMVVERNATLSVAQALRHVGFTSRPESIRVQREPFDTKGARAARFAPDTRFAAGRLWHVEIKFARSLAGPLIAGDGRYLGLGLMKPVKQVEGAHAFSIVSGLSSNVDSRLVARALRRAVMALVQGRLGPRTALPMFFTGHEMDGSPARTGGKAHLAFAFDVARQKLLVIAPHLLEGRSPSQVERKHLELLDAALNDL